MLEGLSVTSVGLIILICVLIHPFLFSRSANNLPPSPGLCLPVIGHFLRADMRPTLARLRKLYVDVYYMQWGNLPVVMLSGYDVIVDAFKKQANLFVARPKLFVLENFTRGKVREHVETYDENCIDDLVSAYVREVKKHELTNEQTSISYEYLESLIGDLFIAGTETTTTALRWSIVCLTEYPEIQESLYMEITSGIDNFLPPTVLNRPSLVHVEAFYMERFRFESPAGKEVSMTTTDGVFTMVHAPKPYRFLAVPRGG